MLKMRLVSSARSRSSSEHLARGRRDQRHVLGSVDLDHDLMQVDLLHLPAAGADLDLHVAVPLATGLERDVDLGGRHALHRSIARLAHAREHGADDRVVVRADLDLAVDRGLEREQVARDLVGQHADIGDRALVLVGEEASLGDHPVGDVAVDRERREHARVERAVLVAHLFKDLAHGHDARHAREGLLDARQVLLGQAIGDDPRRLRAREVIGGLDAAQDHVLAAELPDLVLRLGAGAFTDREHRDHRADAEQEAERRQHAAQLVQHQATDAEPNRAPQGRALHAGPPARLETSARLWRTSRILPSDRCSTCSARSPTSGSWVTIRIVLPSACSSSNSARISSAV